MKKENKKIKKQRRVRTKVQGTAKVPRLSVFRSNQAIYAQLIDDEKAKTLVGVSQKHLEKQDGQKGTLAKEAGLLLAKKAHEKKIRKAVFDRGSYRYHGRVKKVAEGAREGGLEF